MFGRVSSYAQWAVTPFPGAVMVGAPTVAGGAAAVGVATRTSYASFVPEITENPATRPFWIALKSAFWPFSVMLTG